MKSTLTPEVLLDNYINSFFKDDVDDELIPIHWDCQDTDCNNETECYFYYGEKFSDTEITGFAKTLCNMLGVPDDCYNIEFNEDLKEWRIEIICSISLDSFIDKDVNVEM